MSWNEGGQALKVAKVTSTVKLAWAGLKLTSPSTLSWPSPRERGLASSHGAAGTRRWPWGCQAGGLGRPPSSGSSGSVAELLHRRSHPRARVGRPAPSGVEQPLSIHTSPQSVLKLKKSEMQKY